MTRIRVYSAQFNYRYGDVIHFPYSIASLVAYVRSFPALAASFHFEKTFVFRDRFEGYVARAADADVLLCSCYTWNWEITHRLARAVKVRNPRCLVILGGPQVPLQYEGPGTFFEVYPHADILVHQEGEETLKRIFEAYVGARDYAAIPGLETREFRTAPATRISDLDSLPSPYLTGTMLDLIEPSDDVQFIASWETNRGCPYECTFCDWGSATKTRVRTRSMEVLMREIEWFGDHRIPYVDLCDANFGMFPERDLALAEKLKSVKLATGYPGRVRPAWAKVSSEKLIPIARELLDADLLRAVTLAVQSLDPTTLATVKRRNITFNRFADLVRRFQDHGIATYTELIIGLPSETLESFLAGLEQMMELFPRPALFIYNCAVFVNAPMNEPAYRRANGIDVLRSPIYLWHSSPENRGDTPEYEDIVVRANTFSHDDLRQMYVYGWAGQAFHSLGILEYVAKFYHQVAGVRFVDFYARVLDYCRRNPHTLFGREYATLLEYIETGYSGGGWDHADPALAPIYWPIEEATWLRCVRDSGALESGIRSLLDEIDGRLNLGTRAELLDELARFQVFLLSTMDRREAVKQLTARYGWRDFFSGGDGVESLERVDVQYSWANRVIEDDPVQWQHKAIWLGRTQGNYRCPLEALGEERISPASSAATASEASTVSETFATMRPPKRNTSRL